MPWLPEEVAGQGQVGGEGGEVLQELLGVAVEVARAEEHLIVGMIQQIVLQCRMLEVRGLGWVH